MMSLGARLVCQIETDADASRKKQEQHQGQLIVGYESHGVEFTGRGSQATSFTKMSNKVRRAIVFAPFSGRATLGETMQEQADA